MKLGKSTKLGFLAVYSIIFAVITLLIFVLFKPQNIESATCIKDFWVSYSFLALSFIIQLVTVLVFDKKCGDAIFMGLPLFQLSFIYFVAEAFLALIFMILAACKVETPFALVFILQLLALAIFAVCAILAIMGRNFINKVETERKQAVTNIRSLTADLEIAAEAVSNNIDLKKKIEKVAEDVRYSDPMSNKYVQLLDEKIADLIYQVKDACEDGNPDSQAIEEKLRKIRLAVRERNQKISLGK